MAKNRKNSPNPLDEKGEIGRVKPIGKFFRETRGRTGNRGLRRIAKQKATDDRWLFVASQTPPWAAPNKSTNFIHFLQKKEPADVSSSTGLSAWDDFNPGHREDRAPRVAVPTKA